MADEFKYLSPREFHKLGAAGKERYLSALFEKLHPEHKPLHNDAEAGRKPERADAKASKGPTDAAK